MPNYPQSDLIRRLFQKGQPISLGKGEIILGNDSEPNGVYYIDSGYIKIYSLSDDGSANLHIIYGPGELFPMIWGYLNIEPDSLFYEALGDTVLWRISRYWFEHYVQKNLKISYALSRQLAQQFRLYIDRIDNLEYKKASERVAYRLLFLASRFGSRRADGSIYIDAPLTHEVFANSINLARESVSREIEKLEKQGLVKMTDHHIEISDVKTLASKLSRPMSLKDWHLL